MSFKFVLGRLRSLLLLLLGVLRRAICCFRRRRRTSDTPIPLTAVGVNATTSQGANSEMSNWENWEEQPLSVVTDKAVTVQQHIESYRMSRQKPPDEGEPEPDYFEDMSPQITRQMKLLVRKQEEMESSADFSNRLGLNADPALLSSPELEAWEEESSGWEGTSEAAGWETEQALEERRREERQKRQMEQQRRRMEREQQRLSRGGPLGTRLR